MEISFIPLSFVERENEMQVGMEILRTLDPLLFQWCVPIDSWDRYGEKVKKKEKRSKTIHFSKSFGGKGLPNAIENYPVNMYSVV